MKNISRLSLLIGISILILSCFKEKSIEGSNQIASGSLQSDINNDCLPKTVSGIFESGVTLTESNFIIVEVNISATGTFSIETDTLNGYSFSSRGTFSATGIQTVKLLSTGYPIAAGTDNFKISFNGTYCLVQVSVSSGGGASMPAEWKFGEGTNSYQGLTDQANITTQGSLSIFGYSGSSVSNNIIISLKDFSGVLENNEIYKTNSVSGNTAAFLFIGALVTFKADNTTGSVNLEFQLTNHDLVTKTLQGTFTGTVLDAGSLIRSINNGQFTGTYQ